MDQVENRSCLWRQSKYLTTFTLLVICLVSNAQIHAKEGSEISEKELIRLLQHETGADAMFGIHMLGGESEGDPQFVWQLLYVKPHVTETSRRKSDLQVLTDDKSVVLNALEVPKELRTQPNLPYALIQPRYVQSITREHDGRHCRGVLKVHAPSAYSGALSYVARRSRKGHWNIMEIVKPNSRLRFLFARQAGGRWAWEVDKSTRALPGLEQAILPRWRAAGALPQGRDVAEIVIGAHGGLCLDGGYSIAPGTLVRALRSRAVEGGRRAGDKYQLSVVLQVHARVRWRAVRWILEVLAREENAIHDVWIGGLDRATNRRSGFRIGLAMHPTQANRKLPRRNFERHVMAFLPEDWAGDPLTLASVHDAVGGAISRPPKGPESGGNNLLLSVPHQTDRYVPAGLVFATIGAVHQQGMFPYIYLPRASSVDSSIADRITLEQRAWSDPFAFQEYSLIDAVMQGRVALNGTLAFSPSKKQEGNLPEVKSDSRVMKRTRRASTTVAISKRASKDLMGEAWAESQVAYYDKRYKEEEGSRRTSGFPAFLGGAYPERVSRMVAPRRTNYGKGYRRAIEEALRWLDAHQCDDGSWLPGDSHRWCHGVESKVNERARGNRGDDRYVIGVTALATRAFLSAGYTQYGRNDFSRTVRDGLRFLTRRAQQDNGAFWGPGRTNAPNHYNHAIATLAMIESYGMCGDWGALESARRGMRYIRKARRPYFAWGYTPGPGENNTSVTAWMALAHNSAIRIDQYLRSHLGDSDKRFEDLALTADPERFDKDAGEGIQAWLDKVTDPDYGRVGYDSRGSSPKRYDKRESLDFIPESEAPTAMGMMLRLARGENPKKSRILKLSEQLLRRKLPAWDPSRESIDMIYWYFGTLALQRGFPSTWKKWETAMRTGVLKQQEKDGTYCGLRGSWAPAGVWGREGGRVYSTALMAMCFEMLAQGQIK